MPELVKNEECGGMNHFGFACINLITQLGVDKVLNEHQRYNNQGEKCVEVECKINGHEVSLRKLVDRYIEIYDESVKKEALSLINTKLNEFETVALDLIRQIRQEASNKLGIKLEE